MVKLIFAIYAFHSLLNADHAQATKATLLAKGASPVQYCVQGATIDFNPFRKITDGKELAYLLLTRPYISNYPNEPGILKAFEFSPDGHVLTAKIDESAKWSDGQTLTAREAALGIVKGFRYRTIGERIAVEADGLDQPGWQSRDYDNIKIIDPMTFAIHFKSDIANITGVIREALGTNSRHNRVWPVRFDSKLPGTRKTNVVSEVLGVGDLKIDSIKRQFKLPGLDAKIQITNPKDCAGADLSIYFDLHKTDFSSFDAERSQGEQAAIVQLNTKTLPLSDRKIIGQLIRAQFTDLPSQFGIQVSEGFYKLGEPGYSPKSHWQAQWPNLEKVTARIFKIACEIQAYRDVLESKLKSANIKFVFVDYKSSGAAADIKIISTAVLGGRLVFLQDFLSWDKTFDFLKEAPKTLKALQTIAKLSASTIPPDNQTLQNLEVASLEEWALVPLTRRNAIAFSRKTSPVRMVWAPAGEIRFVKRGP